MRKIALFIAMLLLPCVSFAGLLSSNRYATNVLHTLTPAGAAMLRARRARQG